MRVSLRLKWLSDSVVTWPWEKRQTHKTSSKLTNPKVYSLLKSSLGERNWEYENWVAVLAGQRETTCVERERQDTDLEFSFWLSLVVLMCLFARFVSTAACPVWDPFSEFTPKRGFVIFVSLYISLAGVQLSSLPRHFSQSTKFQSRVVPLLPLGVGGRTCPFLVVQRLCKRFVTSGFLLVIFNHCSHGPVTSTLA